MTIPEPSSDAAEHHRRRLRTGWRVAAAGPPVGVVAAIAVGLVGGSGSAGLAVLLLCSAVGLGVAGVVSAWLALVDEHRDRPVRRSRLGAALALLVACPVVIAMSLAAAGA